MTRSSLVALVFAAAFLVQILVSARRRRTNERHTLLWLAIAGAIGGLAIWREGIESVARAMGIYYPPSALFFACIAVLLWVVYTQSLAISDLRMHVRRLAQELALVSSQQQANRGGAERPNGDVVGSRERVP